MGITELAETVRAGLDEDERIARAVGADTIETADHLWDTKYVILHCGDEKRVTTEMDGDLAEHAARHDPRRVLTEVAGKRALLDEALGWRHDVHDDSWFTCQAATDEHDGGTYAETDGGGPCGCGRDARVLAILTHLAQPYQETT